MLESTSQVPKSCGKHTVHTLRGRAGDVHTWDDKHMMGRISEVDMNAGQNDITNNTGNDNRYIAYQCVESSSWFGTYVCRLPPV